MTFQPIFAQEATGSGFGSLIFIVLMLGVFWFMFIRPQRTRMKQQQQLQASLEIGDEVQTIGGVVGRVVSVDEQSVVLEVESGRIRFARRAVSSKPS